MQMKDLQELPKAEKIFREYVNIQAEALIQQSQDLAKKYLNERDELIEKGKQSVQTRRKIKKSLEFLETMLKIPENLRQEINQIKGMTNEDLEEMKSQYEQLLQQYKSDEELNPREEILQESQTTNKQERLQNRGEKALLDNSWNLKRKRIGLGLQILEGVTFVIVILIFLYRIAH